MSGKAIIATAGWKGSGRMHGLAGCPECFLPLRDGTTSASRLSRQLSQLGLEIYIAVGELGYPFGKYMWRGQWAPEGEEALPIDLFLYMMDLSPKDSPWTQDLLDYASEIGNVIQVPDPGRGNSHNSFCVALDEIGEENWDDIVLVQGDMVLPDTFFEQIIEFPRPCQYQMCPNHSVFLLDAEGTAFYRAVCEQPHMREGCALLRDWRKISRQYPNGHPHGTEMMEREGGIKKRALFNTPEGPPPFELIDIDSPRTYKKVREKIADGTINLFRETRKDDSELRRQRVQDQRVV